MTERDFTETWLWERARALIERADRAQRGFAAPQRPGGRRPSWEPPVDVFESGDELWVVVALPGVEPQSVRIELSLGAISVCGERALPPEFRSAQVNRLEIPHGRFERRVGLPEGAYEVLEQRLVDGCLFLTLSKSG